MSIRPMRLLPLVAVSALACVNLGVNDDKVTTVWQGDLQPTSGYPGLSGQAAAVSQIDGTSASVLVQGAVPSESFAWALWLGSCDQPQQQIGPDGSYPGLAADPTGEATADAHFGTRLSIDNAYHIEVRVSATDATRVACADLAGEISP